MQLFDKLKNYSESDAYPMHMPGHKRNGELLPKELPVKYDITEIDGFDNLHEPTSILKKAQERAALLFGAKHTFFSVNGSSGGILAAIRTCALMHHDKTVRALIHRGCHKSVYNALELCSIDPVYISSPLTDSPFIFASIDPKEIENAFLENPDISFVVITSPTYEGVVSDIESIAKIVHKNGALLIVDEAHGSHFNFSDFFPKSAVLCGADIVIQSVHKTLPAMTQTALVHICSDRVDTKALQRQLSIFQTSSPSYILMSSIDSCVSLLAQKSDILFSEYKGRLEDFYEKAKGLKNLKVMPYRDIDGVFARDTSKIVIDSSLTDISGSELSDILRHRFKIECEMSQTTYVLAMTSVCDTDEGFSRLLNALFEIDQKLIRAASPEKVKLITEIPKRRFSISKALSLPSKQVLIKDACGCVSSDYMWAYPPGIPLIVPGEIISKELAEYVIYAQRYGIDIHTSFSDSGYIMTAEL